MPPKTTMAEAKLTAQDVCQLTQEALQATFDLIANTMPWQYPVFVPLLSLHY